MLAEHSKDHPAINEDRIRPDGGVVEDWGYVLSICAKNGITHTRALTMPIRLLYLYFDQFDYDRRFERYELDLIVQSNMIGSLVAQVGRI